jgi:tetratricopeptide (TPR) repeat protein
MSLRFRQYLKILPGLKLIVSKRGLGLNLGVRGAHVTVNTQGQFTRSIGIPGTGLSDVKRTSLRKRKKKSSKEFEEVKEYENQIPKPQPKNTPSIFASKNEKLFFEALTAHEIFLYKNLFSIPELELVSKSIAVQLAIQTDDGMKESIHWFEEIWKNKSDLANNKLFKKYVSQIIVVIPVAPGILFQTYLNIQALGLLYIEVLQQGKNFRRAKQIAEELTADQISAISLSEIEVQLGEYDEVLSLTENIDNVDDSTAILLVFRAIALREKKLFDASKEVLKESLKSKKRNPDILHKALFERAKTHIAEGSKAKAKSDLEKIIANDSDYPGVNELLKAL